MNDLETIVRRAFADRATEAPDAGPLLGAVRERVERDPWRTRAGLLAAAATLAIAATATAMWWPRSIQAPVAAGATSVPTSQGLVEEGECVGLSVWLEAPTRSDGSSGQVIGEVRRGADNALTMTGNQLVHLRAAGPCVDRVSYDIIDVVGADSLQGAVGTDDQRFADGIGLIISHAQEPSRARITLFLRCADGEPCPTSHPLLAEITVTIGGPFLAEATPTAVRPSVTVTTVVESGGVTTQVLPPPPDGSPVTVTVTEPPSR